MVLGRSPPGSRSALKRPDPRPVGVEDLLSNILILRVLERSYEMTVCRLAKARIGGLLRSGDGGGEVRPARLAIILSHVYFSASFPERVEQPLGGQ